MWNSLGVLGQAGGKSPKMAEAAGEEPSRSLCCVKSLQSCPQCFSPTLCDPMDCSPPGSSVRGILQTRRLEWVAVPSPGLKIP